MSDPPLSVERPFARRLIGQAGLEGFGLITGRRVGVRVGPGPVGGGIRFRRTDRRARGAEAPADWRHFVEAPHCTCLEAPSGARFHMVEHCLAALSAARVRDAIVDVRGPELPHLDGSARPYCDMLLEAGLAMAPEAPTIEILAPLAINFGRTRYVFEPAPRFELDLKISLYHIGAQVWRGPIEWWEFARATAAARSFTRLTPLAAARLAGVWVRSRGRIGVVGLYRDRAVNPLGFRMPDELVRHRLIDALGDLALAGAPIRGRVTIAHPSHMKNHRAVTRLMTTAAVWRMTGPGA